MLISVALGNPWTHLSTLSSSMWPQALFDLPGLAQVKKATLSGDEPRLHRLSLYGSIKVP
jgi:hypothetical protein